MPFGRKYRKRKIVTKNRRAYRTRRPYATIKGKHLGTSNLYHSFTRRCDVDQLDVTVDTSIAGATYLSKAYVFKLDDLPNYTEFTTLFDSYRINKVVLYFSFTGNTNGMYDTYFRNMLPEMLYCIDDDDDTAPTADTSGWEQLQQYSRSRFIQIGNRGKSTYTIVIYPSILGMAYNTSITTAYMPIRRRFIDCDNEKVPHYGLKWMVRIPRITIGGNECKLAVNVGAKYYLTCRFPR